MSSTAPRTLADLKERAERGPHGARLLEPIESACAAIEDAELAAIVRFVAEKLGLGTLGAWLGSAEAERAVRTALTPEVRGRLVAAIEQLLEGPEGRTLRVSVTSPRVKVAEPPRLAKDVEAWARTHGVSPVLDRPATAVLPYVESGAHLAGQPFEPGASVHDVLFRRRLPASSSSASTLGEAARRLLTHEAERVALDAERSRARANPPRSLPARRVAVALARLAETVASNVSAQGPERERLSSLELEPSTRTFVARFRPPTRSDSRRVVVARVTLDPASPAARCDCEAGAPCPHALEAIGSALDVLHDEKHPLAQGLEGALAATSGASLLEALEGALSVRNSAEARTIAYRLDVRGERASVVPVIRKRRADGTSTTGAQTTFEKALAEVRSLDDRDLAVAALAAMPHGPSVERALVAAVLATGRVVDPDDSKSLASSRRGSLDLTVEDEGTNVRLGFAVEGRAIDASRVMGREHVVVWDEATRAYVLATIDPRVASLASCPGELEGPRDAVVDKLLGATPPLAMALPASLAGERVPGDARLVVRLDPRGRGGLEASLLARPLDAAGAHVPGTGPVFVVALVDGRRVHVERDLAAERRDAAALRERLGWPESEEEATYFAPDDALDLLTTLMAASGEVRIEWPEGKRPYRVARPSHATLAVRVHDAGRWLGASGDLRTDDGLVPLKAVLDAVRRHRRYVAVDEHTFVVVDDALRDQAAGLLSIGFEADGALAVSHADAARLASTLGRALTFDESARAIAARVEAARAEDDAPLPDLGVKLRAYQVEGVRFLRRLTTMGLGALLADEMGLGKTMQALALLVSRAGAGPSLVVAPTSVVGVWVEHARRCAPSLEVVLHLGEGRHGRVESVGPGALLVTSYEILARDIDSLEEVRFGTVIFDEAHYLKNGRTRRAEAARRLRADARVALTGTPVENHLGDLFGIFDVIVPGLLGTAEHFRARYGGAVERFGDVASRDALRARVAPYVLRRTKKEVAIELPPRLEVELAVDPSAEESLLYEAVRRDALAELTGSRESLAKRRFAVLAAITRLRQLASHPRLVDPASAIGSSKLERFVELALDLAREGRRTLVFSQFVRLLDLVRETLDARGLDSLRLDGATPARERDALVRRFQEGTTPFFLISLRAGGTGLNLTAADYVVHLDPWWNPAVEDQASDRAHRIGQLHPVTVVRMVTNGTIERAVLELHRHKRGLAEALLAESSRIGAADLDALVDLIRGDATS